MMMMILIINIIKKYNKYCYNVLLDFVNVLNLAYIKHIYVK